MDKILGREEELSTLKRLVDSRQPEFLALYGRRRVGKTFLIDRYFRDKGIYFHFTGMKHADLKDHLEIFEQACSERLGISPPKVKSWLNAFNVLRKFILSKQSSQKVILFFDELPWIATQKSKFLQALEHFWNDFACRRSDIILIVCGSAASWMINKIIYNKGGLYSRLTAHIRLEPFSLRETQQYLQYKNIDLTQKQIVEIYMVTGGVAKYLSYVQRGLSSAQIIQQLCFDKNSPLKGEYRELLSSLFDQYETHLSVIQALAKNHYGLTFSELAKSASKSAGGSFKMVVDELKESGFIGFLPEIGKKKKGGRYYLSDEYSLFYLHWMADNPALNNNAPPPNYWLSVQGSASFYSWSGYAFETICKKHIQQIISALNIEVVAQGVVLWRCPKLSPSGQNVQIDLIIQRRDNCLNLCEIKFYSSKFSLDASEAEKVNFRKEQFRKLCAPRQTLFNTLVSAYGCQENGTFFETFDNQLTLEDLFRR